MAGKPVCASLKPVLSAFDWGGPDLPSLVSENFGVAAVGPLRARRAGGPHQRFYAAIGIR